VDSPTTLGAEQGLIEGKPVYDLAGRLVAVKQYDGTAQTDTDILTEFTYTYADKTNYLTEKTMDLPTREMTATYTYGDAAVGEMPDQVYNIDQSGDGSMIDEEKQMW